MIYIMEYQIDKSKTCCFFGHRTINESPVLREHLCKTVEELITSHGIDTFLFGSKSRFDELCLDVVTNLKKKYPHIKRVYARAEYPVIDDKYTAYLLGRYEHTYYSEALMGAGRAVYVKRNREMIDKSGVCVIYYDSNYSPKKRKSGTGLAAEYSVKNGVPVVNVFFD